MLKFLDNRTNQKISKSPIKYQPAFTYGNSYESPKQFQNKYTLFHQPSYVNPYLSYQKQRLVKIPSQSQTSVQPFWKKKLDLQSVQEQKIVNSTTDKSDLNKSKYLTSFYNQYESNSTRFQKNKGQFTTFIEKNLKFKSLGPIHGDHRDQSRINQTKKSVWLKSSKSVFQNDSGLSKRNVSLNFSIKTTLSKNISHSMSKNSQLITQKQRIRQSRQNTYKQFKKALQKRKINKNNSLLFQLPKTGPQHQLTLYDAAKRTFYNSRYKVFENRLSEESQVNYNLDKFQIGVNKRIN